MDPYYGGGIPSAPPHSITMMDLTGDPYYSGWGATPSAAQSSKSSMAGAPSNGKTKAIAMSTTPTDIRDLATCYMYVFDAPGFKATDINVIVEKRNVLRVIAEKPKDEIDGGEGKYVQRERRMTKFMGKFTLSDDANVDCISAVCLDGVLTITVLKLPEPKKVIIEATSSVCML